MEKLKDLLNEFLSVETEFCAIAGKVVDELRNTLDGIFEGKEEKLLVFDNCVPADKGEGIKYMHKEDEEYYVTDTSGDEYELEYELTNSDVGAIAFAIMNGYFHFAN